MAIVRLLTNEANWKKLLERFDELKTDQVIVASIPRTRSKKKSAKAEQIKAWWEKFEQNCVAMALDYKYVYETDVADCYGSIYTHSIQWAIYGKDDSYENREKYKKELGGKLDELFQMMHHRQTNGIPQGNVVSDFIAELIFAYIDHLLIEKVQPHDDIELDDYKIIRYRDDYRIFTNRPDVGAMVLKELTEILADFGLKLNSGKTRSSDDIVTASIKRDKIDELFIPDIKKEKDNFAKWLMQMYASIARHPNSGSVSRQLTQYHRELLSFLDDKNSLREYERADVMLGIVSSIAVKNPKYYNIAMAVASLLVRGAEESQRQGLVGRLLAKFDKIPNTGLLDIWVQRISYPIDVDKSFNEELTKVVNELEVADNSNVWNVDWLKDQMKKVVVETKVVDVAILKKIRENEQIAMSVAEVDLFVDIPS